MRSFRITPSMGVALLALLLAVCGGAYAAGKGSSSTILACVHRSGGGLYIAHKKCTRGDKSLTWNVTGPQGPAGAPGTAGTAGSPGAAGAAGTSGLAGAPATNLFAQVKEDGTLDASSPGVTVTRAAGNFFVNFGQNITHCAAIAQEGSLPVSGGSEGSSPPETADVILSGSTGEYTTGFPDEDTVDVITYFGKKPAYTDFYLAVFC